MKVTGPGLGVSNVKYIDGSGDHNLPVEITDPMNFKTVNTYDANGSVTAIQLPSGAVTNLTYDVRGNVVRKNMVPAPGSGLPALNQQWKFVGPSTMTAESCTAQTTCNRPASYIDARGNQTDYIWDGVNGLPTSRFPAPKLMRRFTPTTPGAWPRHWDRSRIRPRPSIRKKCKPTGNKPSKSATTNELMG